MQIIINCILIIVFYISLYYSINYYYNINNNINCKTIYIPKDIKEDDVKEQVKIDNKNIEYEKNILNENNDINDLLLIDHVNYYPKSQTIRNIQSFGF